ncbi:type II and III secretion system protein [Campylobacter sp. FMV-PI01]|uniref:Type II and III secretion system protein n=1 Tax=Campylobacter portucalensis TaxID=2608384 RepID=A0A6L5WHS8_9BACT|nr:ABC transporter ATP-binding protein [Campylobacter portucalensis]MSN95992.1 type II and III secretion system protein [Campylobacter portucalensis]
MKLLQKITLLVLLLGNLYALEYKNIKFSDFLGEISGITGKNIVISGNIDTNFDVFLPTLDLTKVEVIGDLLHDILKVNNLDYTMQDSIILIYSTNEKEKPILNDYIIKFKNISKEDVTKALELFQENIKYSVYSDRVLLLTTESQYQVIKSMISGLDTSYQLRQLSFSIIATDNSRLKEVGPKIDVLLNSLDHFYLKVMTNVLTVDSSSIRKDSVSSLINLLQSNGISELLYNPRITLIDNKDSVIESVVKTPIKKSNINVENSQTVTTEEVIYENVGLKLNISGVLITNDSVSFALDLYIENLLDDSNTPRISSRHIKTNVHLTYQNSYLIGGINSKEVIKSKETIPVIEHIPVIGDLFSYKNEKINNYSFSVFITLIPDPCKVYFVRYLNDDGTLRTKSQRDIDLSFVCAKHNAPSELAGDPRSGESQ